MQLPQTAQTVGAGIHMRSAPILVLNPFSSGRKSTIELSSFLYVFNSSDIPWIENEKETTSYYSWKFLN